MYSKHLYLLLNTVIIVYTLYRFTVSLMMLILSKFHDEFYGDILITTCILTL